MRIEVEGDENYLRRLKGYLETEEAVDDVEVLGDVSQDVLDTVELTLDRVEKGKEITLGQLVKRSGVPRSEAESAVKKLGREEDLRSP